MTSLDEFETLVNLPYNDIAKFILTDDATKGPETPEITGWREISPAALHVDLYRFIGFADAFSSLYVDNIGAEPLRIRFLAHGYLVWEKFVAPGSRQVFEFLSEPYPRGALPFSHVSVEFSHAEYRSKIRYLIWANKLSVARARENHVMIGKRTDNNLTHVYFVYNGMFKPLQWHNDLPAEDLQGYVLEFLNQSHVPHPRNRLYKWVRCLPEPQPGKYILPEEPQIYSSIYVENPAPEPITLWLLPNFRHKYILQPGTNLLELFWQEFWRGDGGDSGDNYYLQSRTSGLKISLRVGNQRAKSVRYPVMLPPTYNETASTLISPDYYVYRCGGGKREPPKLTACYNRKDLAQSTCLLGLHSRTGKDSSLRAYFQDHPLNERYLLPEIWRFLG